MRYSDDEPFLLHWEITLHKFLEFMRGPCYKGYSEPRNYNINFAVPQKCHADNSRIPAKLNDVTKYVNI